SLCIVAGAHVGLLGWCVRLGSRCARCVAVAVLLGLLYISHGYRTQSYSVAKAVGEATPLRRPPSRYAARQARRPILPLEGRGMVPACTSSTSRTVTPCPTATAARMSSAMGW